MKVAQMKATHLQTNYLESFNLSIMKKFISAALVVAMTAASCANKEDLGTNNENLGNDNNNNTTELPSQDENQSVTSFTADFGDPMSKALPSYSDQTKTVTVLWEADDKVGVYAGENGPAEFTAQAAGATTTLKGSIGAADTYYAMYPYDANASIAAGQISTALPAEQTATADEFAAHLAVASTTGSSLSFQNVCALVRVYVGCEHVTKIEFKGNNDEVVAGDIVVDAATAEFSHGTTQEKVVTVTPPADAATFPVGAYYFSVLPKNFTEGFTVTYYTANGNVDTRSTDAVNVQRSNLVVGRPLTAIAGEGSEASPFIVANVHDLCCLSEVLLEDSANYVELANDIDMSGVETWTPINNDRRPENVREIHFDGKNYIISNFAPTTFIDGLALEEGELVSKTNYSLFGILYGSCKNLTIEDADVDQASSSTTAIVAAYAGYNGIDNDYQTLFENVHASGTVKAKKVVAGFVADICNVKFVNCSADVDVYAADNHTGGFAARSNDGGCSAIFEGCCSTGDVSNSSVRSRYNGSFYGGNNVTANMTFTRCYSTGNVVADYQIGAFIGYVDAGTVNVTDCYATGNASRLSGSTNGKQFGGIIGVSKATLTMTRCFFGGTLNSGKAESVGGILGLGSSGTATITSCFSTGSLTSPTKEVGGIVGHNKGNSSMVIDGCFASGTLTAPTQVGSIVGMVTKATTIKNCKHNANVDLLVGSVASGITVTEENNAKLAENEVANYATASAVATALGWSTETWNLSGDTPTLKCFE